MPIQLILALLLGLAAVGAARWLFAAKTPPPEAAWRQVAVDTHQRHLRLQRAVVETLNEHDGVAMTARHRLDHALRQSRPTGVSIPAQRTDSDQLRPFAAPTTDLPVVGPGFLATPTSRTSTDVQL